KAYGEIVERVRRMAPLRTFLATVPHVTIAPVCRGVSPFAKSRGEPERTADGYYEFYTHFWIWDDDFRPYEDPAIKREDARAIDSAIDEYNEFIRATAKSNDWRVLDLCKLLDDLAFRRTGGAPPYRFPRGLVAALEGNAQTRFRVRPEGTVLLDSRYMRIPDRPPPAEAPPSEWQAAYRGGLFGLDAVHPTTIGY